MAGSYYYAFVGGLICVALSFALSFAATFLRRPIPALLQERAHRAFFFGTALFALWAAVVLLVISAAGRTIVAKAPPMADMWGYFLVLAIVVLVLGALFASRYREPGVLLLTTVMVGATLFFSDTYFSAETRPLVPALRANRVLTLHVSTLMLAYGLIGIAFVASAEFLLKSYFPGIPGFPHPDRAYRIAHEATVLAFLTLTLGIAFGAYWASNAWGRYWGWDPKETASAITWLLLVEYLHVQGLRSWQGRRASWLLVIGFFSIVFNMLAVNFWIGGLHSYA